MVRGEDVSARLGKILDALGTKTEQEFDERPGNDAD